MKFKNIIISGDIGTGKSTLARNLAHHFKWKYVSTGEFFRKWHKENAISLNHQDKIPEDFERSVDAEFERMVKEDSNLVMESQLGGWFARNATDSFAVLCTASFEESMKRAAKRDKVSIEEATIKSKDRSSTNNRRYKRLYGVENRFDPKYFDLVVDTTTISPEEVMQQVLEKLTIASK